MPKYLAVGAILQSFQAGTFLHNHFLNIPVTCSRDVVENVLVVVMGVLESLRVLKGSGDSGLYLFLNSWRFSELARIGLDLVGCWGGGLDLLLDLIPLFLEVRFSTRLILLWFFEKMF